MNTAEKLEARQNSVTEVAPGIWLIDFPTPEMCIAAQCGHLVPPLIEAAKKGRLVVLAQLSPLQRSVEIAMPTFWLNAFTKQGAKASAIGVVTRAAAVKVAVKGFHLAMRTVGAPIEAMTFDDASAAIAWAKTVVEPRK